MHTELVWSRRLFGSHRQIDFSWLSFHFGFSFSRAAWRAVLMCHWCWLLENVINFLISLISILAWNSALTRWRISVWIFLSCMTTLYQMPHSMSQLILLRQTWSETFFGRSWATNRSLVEFQQLPEMTIWCEGDFCNDFPGTTQNWLLFKSNVLFPYWEVSNDMYYANSVNIWACRGRWVIGHNLCSAVAKSIFKDWDGLACVSAIIDLRVSWLNVVLIDPCNKLRKVYS